ncbi:MAG: enoyl-CoA hydratase/isomerase family protein [Deltaproteobacteria bacterium]|nr:enoyl-CoA hydratase/isomerase family protein [Deltaproteobacteria bacterium]
MADPILINKNGDITTITLNRPEAGNRQTDATWAQVTQMFDDAAKTSRLILFKGAGEDFCLGREAMGQPTPVLEAYAVRDRSETIFNLYGAFRNARVPIIGVVQGRARKAATFMIYSAQEIDAHKALTFGLVSDVVPHSELDASVSRLVEHFTKMPMAAVLAVKEYARTAFGISTQAATDFARNLHATVNSFSGMRG